MRVKSLNIYIWVTYYCDINESKVTRYIFLDGYYSTVQGLLDWFEVDLGFTELLFTQIDLCVKSTRYMHLGDVLP